MYFIWKSTGKVGEDEEGAIVLRVYFKSHSIKQEREGREGREEVRMGEQANKKKKKSNANCFRFLIFWYQTRSVDNALQKVMPFNEKQAKVKVNQKWNRERPSLDLKKT